MVTKPGTRVIAMSHTSDDKKTIYIFGYGVYEGHFNYGDVVSTEPSDKLFCGNPRIKLDNGKYVWGCECWWGDEERARAQFAKSGINVVEIDIDQERAKCMGQSETHDAAGE